MPKPTFFNLPEDKRRLILNLAIEEFAQRDYNSASISNIVSQAGIAKGSLYQYFADKRELYFYLLELAAEEKKRFLMQSPPPDPNMGLFEYLRWLMESGAHFELSRPQLAQVAYRALFSDRPFGDEPFQQMVRAANDFYTNLIALGVARGSIDPHIDRSLAAFVLSAVFNQFGRYLVEQQNVDPKKLASGEVDYQQLSIAEITGRLIDILERGLAPRCQPEGN